MKYIELITLISSIVGILAFLYTIVKDLLIIINKRRNVSTEPDKNVDSFSKKKFSIVLLLYCIPLIFMLVALIFYFLFHVNLEDPIYINTGKGIIYIASCIALVACLLYGTILGVISVVNLSKKLRQEKRTFKVVTSAFLCFIISIGSLFMLTSGAVISTLMVPGDKHISYKYDILSFHSPSDGAEDGAGSGDNKQPGGEGGASGGEGGEDTGNRDEATTYYVSTTPLSCKLNNGYDYSAPDPKKDDVNYTHEYFSFGNFVIDGSSKDTDKNDTFLLRNNLPISIKFRVEYDTNNLPVQGKMKSRYVYNDSEQSGFYNLPWNVGKRNVGKGMIVVLVEYQDGTPSDKICVTNAFDSLKAGTNVTILNNITKPCKISIAICYSLVQWAPGLFGIVDDYWTDWRINQTFYIE